MILAVHREHFVVAEGRALDIEEDLELALDLAWQGQDVPAVAIAAEQVFTADARPVRGRPAEDVAVDDPPGTPRHTTASAIPARRRI